MKLIVWIAAFLIVLLGLVHIGFTFHDYTGLSFEAIWFAGSGVAIVLAGFLNIAMLRDGGKDTVIWSMSLIANVVFIVMFAAAAFMLREPQVFLGLLFFAVTTFYSFFINPKTT